MPWGVEPTLPLPVGTAVVIGPSGCGKSVISYVVAAAYLRNGYTVVYVNYKQCPERAAVGDRPSNGREASEFEQVMADLAEQKTLPAHPDRVGSTISSTTEPCCCYTEPYKGLTVKTLLSDVHGAGSSGRQRTLVLFDEVLNEDQKASKSLLSVHNQGRTKQNFVLIQHQNLAAFWQDKDWSRIIHGSNVIIAGLDESDDERSRFRELLESRTPRDREPEFPISWEDMQVVKKHRGGFVLFPCQGATSTYPVLGRIPTVELEDYDKTKKAKKWKRVK